MPPAEGADFPGVAMETKLSVKNESGRQSQVQMATSIGAHSLWADSHKGV
jgi:hypothetical protein